MELPPDRFLCKMCQVPCCETEKSECYGSAVFCKHELEKLKAATAAWPVTPFKVYPDVAADHEIKGLKVYCRNKEVGCGCS